MGQPPATIDDVIARLETIVDDAIRKGSPIGYFAALYERVTRAVSRAIVARAFDDGLRMELLDRTFAGRFLDAWDAYGRGEPASLGISAHINLDLGIAAATIAPGFAIASLQGDFDRINSILARLVGAVQLALGEVSPRFRTIDAIQTAEDKLFDFTLDKARAEAWSFAQTLAAAPQERWGGLIAERDAVVAALGECILKPSALAAPVIAWVRAAESKDTTQNIQVMGA
jgi:hypothetical protein